MTTPPPSLPPVLPLLSNSHAFLIPLSLPTPAINCLEATAPCGEFTRRHTTRKRKRQTRSEDKRAEEKAAAAALIPPCCTVAACEQATKDLGERLGSGWGSGSEGSCCPTQQSSLSLKSPSWNVSPACHVCALAVLTSCQSTHTNIRVGSA